MCEVEQWEKALDHLESLIKLTWVDVDEARAWRSRILAGQGRHAEALRLMGARQESDPMLIPLAATLHARFGNHEKALALLREAKALKLPDSELAKGDVYAALGNKLLALDAYERAVQTSWLPSTASMAARSAGEMLLELDDPSEAVSAFGLAVRIRPYLSRRDVDGMVTVLRRCKRNRDADQWSALLEMHGAPQGGG